MASAGVGFGGMTVLVWPVRVSDRRGRWAVASESGGDPQVSSYGLWSSCQCVHRWVCPVPGALGLASSFLSLAGLRRRWRAQASLEEKKMAPQTMRRGCVLLWFDVVLTGFPMRASHFLLAGGTLCEERRGPAAQAAAKREFPTRVGTHTQQSSRGVIETRRDQQCCDWEDATHCLRAPLPACLLADRRRRLLPFCLALKIECGARGQASGGHGPRQKGLDLKSFSKNKNTCAAGLEQEHCCRFGRAAGAVWKELTTTMRRTHNTQAVCRSKGGARAARVSIAPTPRLTPHPECLDRFAS